MDQISYESVDLDRDIAGFIRKCALALIFLAMAFLPAAAKTFKFDIQIGGKYFTPSPVPLETIINRYFEWRGGAAYARLQSFHAKSSATAGGAPISAEIWMDRKGRWREDRVNAVGIAHRFGISSDSSWVSNAIGQSENDPASLTFARRMALIEFGDALRPGHGAQVTLLGLSKGQFLGTDFGLGDELKDWAYVQVSFGDSDRYVLAIDPETGALAGYLIAVHGQNRFYLFGNWRFVEGVRMPFWRISHGDTDDDEDFAISSIDLNNSFPESVFGRPPPSHAFSFEGPEKTTGWINFTLEQGVILVPVNVNGVELRAIIDNGTASSLIDNSIAKKLLNNNRVVDDILVPSGNNNYLKVNENNKINVKIANLTFKNMFAYSGDMSSISKSVGFPVLLLLGDEAFFELIVDIDFQNMKLSFSESPHYLDALSKYAVPLLRNGFHPVVRLSIEDGPPFDFMVDLGQSAPLEIFPSYLQSAPDLAERPWSPSYVVGADGSPEESRVITLKNVKLGEVSLENVPAGMQQLARGRYPTEVMGAVGAGLFGGARVIIDYSRDRLYFIPAQEGTARPFFKEHLGAFIHHEEGGWVVKSVASSGPAAKTGLKVGDVIVEIDGKPIDLDLLKDAWGGAVGRVVKMTLLGGDTKDIRLEEYY